MTRRLDDIYKMTAAIYEHANMTRSREATYLHFVEVCSMLTMTHRQKHRDRVDMSGALCKVLGWYFPLMAKMGVESIEDMIFSKFPRVCPYCRLVRHEEAKCKLVKGTEKTVNHDDLKAIIDKNIDRKPAGLNEWQEMFEAIYPRPLNATPFSILALFEELGELAEAIRVFDRYPHYFYGEAADVFSYIMGIANEYRLQPEGADFDFEAEYLSRYPGLCINCGYHKCACPPVPAATIGRMAKELSLSPAKLSISDAGAFSALGLETGREVFESVSKNPDVGKYLPYDRGDLNDAMMQLCYRLANSVALTDQGLADQLRGEAINLGVMRQERGTVERAGDPVDLLRLLRRAWSASGDSDRGEIQKMGGAVAELAGLFELRVLVATSNPTGENDLALRLDRELKIIRTAFKKAGLSERDIVTHLSAASIDDFLNELRDNQYDIVHFSGHADNKGLSFMKESGDDDEFLPYDALSAVLARQERLQCVILNACESMSALSDPVAPLVVGMIDTIDDEDALAFSTGFYEALASRMSPEDAFEQGVTRVKAKGGDADIVAKLVQRSRSSQ